MTKRVTIVIATYNGEKYIEKTIESCLDQTFENINIIVIDDCSTDRTRELLKEFKEKNVQVIFNEKNLGFVKNVNKALEKINDDYFMIVGHDDILPKNHVELLLTEFDDDTVAVHCNSKIIDSEGNEKGFSRNDSEQILKTKNCLFELSLDNFISSCGMLHKKNTYNLVGGWDEKYLHYGEWLYYIQILSHGKIKYSTKTYAFYRRHDTNMTNSFKNKDVLILLDKYKSECRKLAHKKNNNSLNEFVRYWLNLGRLNVKNKIKKFI